MDQRLGSVTDQTCTDISHYPRDHLLARVCHSNTTGRLEYLALAATRRGDDRQFRGYYHSTKRDTAAWTCRRLWDGSPDNSFDEWTVVMPHGSISGTAAHGNCSLRPKNTLYKRL